MSYSSRDSLQSISFPHALALAFGAWFVECILSMLMHRTLVAHGVQPMAAAALIRVLACGMVFSALLHLHGLNYRQLFHESQSSAAATIGLLGPPLLLTVPLFVLIDGWVMEWLVKLLPMSAGEQAMLDFRSGGLGGWILVCGIAPLVEEMLYRGILLRGMLVRYAPADAIVYSAFAFGVGHMNVYQFVVAFFAGLVTAVLYRRTRSLWPGIVLHAGVNTMIMAMPEGPTSVWAWIASAFAAAVGVLLLRRMLWRPSTPLRAGPAAGETGE